jgi:hypothetical protein
MDKFFKLITIIYLSIYSTNLALSSENFFDEAMKLYQDKKYDDARFLFERNIVFNPKDAKSYLYLAKIYNNEEVILMLMQIALKKSNFSKVKDLSETFVKVCKKLCNENNEIQKSLKNLEPENES